MKTIWKNDDADMKERIMKEIWTNYEGDIKGTWRKYENNWKYMFKKKGKNMSSLLFRLSSASGNLQELGGPKDLGFARSI